MGKVGKMLNNLSPNSQVTDSLHPLDKPSILGQLAQLALFPHG
jgi:hypothetical protein